MYVFFHILMKAFYDSLEFETCTNTITDMEVLQFISSPWPWYIAGPLIGLMVPALLLVDNRQFGVSSTMRDFCAKVLPKKNIPYFDYNLKNHIWRNLFVLGSLLGGSITVIFFKGSGNVEISPDTIGALKNLGINDFKGLVPQEIFSFDNLLSIKGIVLIVGGGFLVGFGTRWADGCTSGHAIMGLSLLSPASLVSVIGFFVGGLISTHLLLPLIL